MLRDLWVDKACELLTSWGEWLRTTPGAGSSLTSQYNERIGSGFSQVLPDNETAARVEVILCRIKQTWPEIFLVLHSRYYYEHSYEEVAGRMKISKSTVKNWQRLGEVSVVSYWDAGYGINQLRR